MSATQITKVTQIKDIDPVELLSMIQEINNRMASLESKLEQILKPTSSSTTYVKRKELMKMLGISGPTITDWTKKGILTGYMVGNKIYYKEDEIEKSMKRITSAAF